ncbi:MAG: isoleucine--tRNA ligase [Actinomycetia bacterium]|nr:isoleucine--tRNA ligase [Actinomycetes bacterium]
MTYPTVASQPSFPANERDVLAFWEADATFEASVDRRDGADEYVFYDGPPFANGLPHYGHLLTGFVKDAIPRYRTMRGQQVHRRFGWDCHGLPAEVVAEKELGISGHPAITKFGIDKFNDACRTSVLRFTDDWHRYVTRQARWVDFEHGYKTLDTPYMESVMWAFKTLWDKGLVYEGFRVLAYCWRCETPLSNTETRMDDVYRDRQDPALTVQFQLDTGERILAWTTTPWTLPSNLALAVGPTIDYAVMEQPDNDGKKQRYILAESRLGAYEKELAGAVQVGTLTGAELVGRRYTPLFPYFADTENAFHVLAADYVSTEDGTGVVHMAPGFGEEDQIVCNAVGIPTICPMDEHGRFTADVPTYAGVHVFEANAEVIKDLKARGLVVRHDSYQHSYPHCWRCNEPLVYRAISSWFVQVTAFRDRMVELNQQIRWVPEHVKEGSFGKWIANARDWSISRNRFWGSPIPVWRSDNPEYPRVDVYGSIADLERDFGVTVTDLHRPHVDDLVRPNPDDPTGKSMMRRVPQVLDCWFESGSMPFAQVHYPFENRDWFDTHNPGDFIVEYIGQTRGWFYTLHVLSTALFDRPSFRTCVSHGIVQGDDGQKMSKSLNNYADPMAMFDTYGSDAMRWYLLSSPILRGTDMIVSEEGSRDAVRQVMLPIWNSWYFLSLYANAANTQGTFRTEGTYSTDVLDRYILAKMHDLLVSLTATMDEYDLFAACASVRAFLDALTNWYVRRSRDRFWAGDQDAIDTLHTVLALLCRALAPLLPLTTEAVYQPLTGERSVHLTDWPSADSLPADAALVEAMDLARDVCSSTLRLRKSHQLRVRQPLATLKVAVAGADRLAPFRDLIADEVNVKAIDLTDDVASVATFDLQVIPAGLGPRLGDKTQHVIKAVKTGDWQRTGDAVVAGGIELLDGEYALKLVVQGEGASTPMSTNGGVVVLDTALTAELTAEGVTRDLVRLVQQARRDAGLQVSDRIALTLGVPESVRRQVVVFQHLLTDATLSTSLTWGIGASDFDTNGELDGDPIHIGVTLVK